MKKAIIGAVFGTLLVAAAAGAQTPRTPSFAQPAAVVDVPATFALRDANVDVAASIPRPRSFRLGEIAVLRLEDKEVRLRFATLGAMPPEIPAGAPRGQALATVSVDVVVRHR